MGVYGNPETDNTRTIFGVTVGWTFRSDDHRDKTIVGWTVIAALLFVGFDTILWLTAGVDWYSNVRRTLEITGLAGVFVVSGARWLDGRWMFQTDNQRTIGLLVFVMVTLVSFTARHELGVFHTPLAFGFMFDELVTPETEKDGYFMPPKAVDDSED